MDEETNLLSRILYTILIILVCVILGVYLGRLLVNQGFLPFILSKIVKCVYKVQFYCYTYSEKIRRLL